MRINDKVLTVVTGAMLAVGGAAASLFLGDHGNGPGYQPNLTVAELTSPTVPLNSFAPQTRIGADLVQATPTLPQTDASLVVASLEVPERQKVRADLVEVAVLDGAPDLAMLAEITDIVLTRSIASVPAPVMPLVAAGRPTLKLDVAQELILPQVNPLNCDLDIRATPIFGARVKLKLVAPCHPNVVVTIEHGGLRFKEKLDADGVLELKVPAFAEYARFSIELADGTKTTVGAYIAGLSALERVGIAWAGGDDTFLHAYQNGAKSGSDGHIWRLNARSFAKARMDGGGYMMLLGNPELENTELAQVYTLGAKPRKRAQIVELEIETLRGDSACGEDMTVAVARHRAKSGSAQSGIALNLPGCEDAGSLVLKNVLKDMKVAAK